MLEISFLELIKDEPKCDYRHILSKTAQTKYRNYLKARSRKLHDFLSRLDADFGFNGYAKEINLSKDFHYEKLKAEIDAFNKELEVDIEGFVNNVITIRTNRFLWEQLYDESELPVIQDRVRQEIKSKHLSLKLQIVKYDGMFACEEKLKSKIRESLLGMNGDLYGDLYLSFDLGDFLKMIKPLDLPWPSFKGAEAFIKFKSAHNLNYGEIYHRIHSYEPFDLAESFMKFFRMIGDEKPEDQEKKICKLIDQLDRKGRAKLLPSALKPKLEDVSMNVFTASEENESYWF